jgi:hypothetical protein
MDSNFNMHNKLPCWFKVFFPSFLTFLHASIFFFVFSFLLPSSFLPVSFFLSLFSYCHFTKWRKWWYLCLMFNGFSEIYSSYFLFPWVQEVHKAIKYKLLFVFLLLICHFFQAIWVKFELRNMTGKENLIFSSWHCIYIRYLKTAFADSLLGLSK